MGPPPQKINLISYEPLAHISDIKLIRTDTTLDLSQKAEKVVRLEGMSTSTVLVLNLLAGRRAGILSSFQVAIGEAMSLHFGCVVPGHKGGYSSGEWKRSCPLPHHQLH
ncbi:hypothetical protein ACOSQ4_031881 [Xanthoceras sorbifolium]